MKSPISLPFAALLLSLTLPLACNRKKSTPPPESSDNPANADPADPPADPQPIEPLSPLETHPPAEATGTKSGLYYKITRQGKGQQRPGLEDQVVVNFTGWTSDGKSFDSTAEHGTPSVLRVGRIIDGLTEGLQLLTLGSKARFWIPMGLAFGDQSRGFGEPGGDLIMDIELLEIRPAPKAPPDVAGPPPDSTKTSSGLSWRVLTPGQGTQHPTENDKVRVNFTGWTTNGRFYASSSESGAAVVRVNSTVKGMAEGLQLMVEGEKRRLWIPEALAFGSASRANVPFGMVVFDVELLKIEDPNTPDPPPRPRRIIR